MRMRVVNDFPGHLRPEGWDAKEMDWKGKSIYKLISLHIKQGESIF